MTGQTTVPKPNNVPKKAQPRHLARIGAVQALYQMDMVGADASDVIEEFQKFRFAAEPKAEASPDDDQNDADLHGGDVAFFTSIVEGVVAGQRQIDPLIDKQLATGWRLGRVDSILRAILRAGTFELMERTDVPPRVVLNEYINVGHAFFSGDEPRVINGVLDALAGQLRAGSPTSPPAS